MIVRILEITLPIFAIVFAGFVYGRISNALAGAGLGSAARKLSPAEGTLPTVASTIGGSKDYDDFDDDNISYDENNESDIENVEEVFQH